MLHQQEIEFSKKGIQFYKSKEQSEHEKVAIDKEREEIKRNKEEAAKEKDEQDRIIMALGEQKSADEDETQPKNDDISIHSSIPKPLRHLTCLERKKIQDDFSSYDDDESSSDYINQRRINLSKTIRLSSVEQDVSCNEWIEPWINRISNDHVTLSESLLTRKKFFLLNEQ
jgi:hypothetical protein